jgi:tRNA(fMet)-specific endonuclease VapC
MTYGKVPASLEQRGKPIGPLDTLIGSHALKIDAVLVTHNTTEFSRIEGLRLEGWTQS